MPPSQCRCLVRNGEASITELRASDMIDDEDNSLTNVKTSLGVAVSFNNKARQGPPLYTGPQP